MHDEHIMCIILYHCYKFVGYNYYSTRVGSKHISRMIIILTHSRSEYRLPFMWGF